MTAGVAPLPGEHFVTLDVHGRPASYSTAGTLPWKEAVRAAVTSVGMKLRAVDVLAYFRPTGHLEGTH